MAITLEDMARLAQLYLNSGKWNGRQLVPENWIRAATVSQCDNSNGVHRPGNEDWEAGYGYQLWMNQPHGSYRFDGAHGQEALICPDQDLAILFNAATHDLADLLRLVWRLILGNVSNDPLPENPGGCKQMRMRLRTLKLPELMPVGPSLLQEGINEKRIVFRTNNLSPVVSFRLGGPPSSSGSGVQWVEAVFGGETMTLRMQTSTVVHTIQAGMDGDPRINILAIDDDEIEFYASARWTDQNELSVVLRRMRVVQSTVLTITYHMCGAEMSVRHFPGNEVKSTCGEYHTSL